MTTDAREASPDRQVVERRSIEYVPLAERHGKAWHQGPFWFGGNFILLTMTAGFLGPANGLTVGWSILAIATGAGFGTFFMAFHANQGPRLGLPQMIQSRAQLGTQGAVFSLTAAVLVYIGFIVFNIVLIAEAVGTVLPGGKWLWYPVAVAVVFVIATVGHDLLHFIERWNTFILIVFYLVFTIYALYDLLGHPATAPGGTGHLGFNLAGFLIQFSVAAGYQITYAVYVSDYSRYLPRDTPAAPLIIWTYAGAAASAIWLMSLGAFLSAHVATEDIVTAVVEEGNGLFPHFGTIMVLISIPAMIGINSVNSYGAMLSGASAVDGFKRLQPGLRVRVIGLLIVDVICLALAIAIPANYLGTFNSFITIVLYFLVPWTAVNLVDFYFVRRGHYAIPEIFNPHGIYRRWPYRGVTSYLVGIATMTPFMVVFGYEGPGAKLFGGADFSFLIGLVVAGGLYYVLNIGRDFTSERELAERLNRELENAVS